MPELPEVETVRRGLEPAMRHSVIAGVRLNRSDLRFPFPDNFRKRLDGATVEALGRRGKYLLLSLSTGETLIMHLGMSGRFSVLAGSDPELGDSELGDDDRPGAFHYAGSTNPAHDHVVFEVEGPAGPARVVYNDPRRFGFMDLAPSDALETSRHFAAMGPEPLSNSFSEGGFNDSLKGKKTSIKAALLDQRVVAGVGNIYACEALFRAGVSPRRQAASVAGRRGARLWRSVRDVLTEAIEAGGSSLRDFASAEGGLGYFQHRFKVYDREEEACPVCGAGIRRITQSARSTFYCGRCQK